MTIDDDAGPLVPVAFAVTVQRRPPDPSPDRPASGPLEALRDVRVVVIANGVRYGGVLMGADETDLYLRGEFRYIVMPLHQVSSVVREEPDRTRLGGWQADDDASEPQP